MNSPPGGAGPRDVGVPAALDGDVKAALAWIERIPSRFRPARLPDDPAFTALRPLPEFQKLFAHP